MQRNPPGVHPARAIFKRSRHARRLNLWALPSPDSTAHNAIETNEDKNSNWDSNTFHFNRDDDEPHTAWTDDITDGTISWHSQSTRQIPPQNASSTRPSAAIHCHATSSKPSSEQGYINSNIFTQNAHGLRHPACDEHGNLRPNSPHDYTKYEHLITTMKLKGIDAYFVQETWLEGDVFDEIINGFHLFHHNGEVGHHNFHTKYCK